MPSIYLESVHYDHNEQSMDWLQLYSIAGFVWNNRRYNMDSRNVSCVTMKHLLWKVQQKYTDSDEE